MNLNLFENLNFQLLESMLDKFNDFLPRLLAAIIFLIVCWLVLKVSLLLLEKILKIAKVDHFVNNLRHEVFKSAQLEFEASKIIVTLVKWFLIVVFVLIGSDLLGLERFSNVIGELLSYLPQFFAGLVIFILGMYLSIKIRKGIINTLHALGIMGAKIIGQFIFVIMMVFIIITSLNQMNVDTSFITNNISIIVAAFFASIALAVGLGSKSVVQKILYVFYARRIYKVGDRVLIGENEGIIIFIDNLSFAVVVNNEKQVYPIEDILNNKIKILTEQAREEAYPQEEDL